MEYLQYLIREYIHHKFSRSFKPCYKWNTFNTTQNVNIRIYKQKVLNLVINGIPSILDTVTNIHVGYNVLNLVINGIPSIPLI